MQVDSDDKGKQLKLQPSMSQSVHMKVFASPHVSKILVMQEVRHSGSQLSAPDDKNSQTSSI